MGLSVILLATLNIIFCLVGLAVVFYMISAVCDRHLVPGILFYFCHSVPLSQAY